MLARWARLPDYAPELKDCTEEERTIVRGLEEQGIQAEFAQLSDLVLNCYNKYQFANTYKTLRADLRNLLAYAQKGNPKAPPHLNRAVAAALERVGREKLHLMAGWFYIHFSDPRDDYAMMQEQEFRVENVIERYAGKEGAGCLGLVLVGIGQAMAEVAYRLMA